MADRYGIDIISGTAQVVPALPDARTAELLCIPQNQPCFRIQTLVRDRRGRIVEYGESVYRGDFYTITVELQAQRPRSRPGPLEPQSARPLLEVSPVTTRMHRRRFMAIVAALAVAGTGAVGVRQRRRRLAATGTSRSRSGPTPTRR